MTRRRPMTIVSIWVLAGLCLGAAGCRTIALKTPPAETVGQPLTPWDPASYAEFVAENMAYLNQRYSDEYAPYTFIVDTPHGSSRIQELLSFEPASQLLSRAGLKDLPDGKKSAALLRFVQNRFIYQLEPNRWVSTVDTVEVGRGDCKGLSLLLLTLIEAAGLPAYAAISNGHMWVNAYYDDRWHVLEIDTDVERNRIYQLAGFYDKPLYKIYTHHTMKRIPLEPSTR